MSGSRGPGCPSACQYRHRPTCAEHRTNRGQMAERPAGRASVGKSPPTGDPCTFLAFPASRRNPRKAEAKATGHRDRGTIDLLSRLLNSRRYLWPAGQLARGFLYAFLPDNAYRWTDGDGLVPAELLAGLTGASMLELVVAGDGNLLLVSRSPGGNRQAPVALTAGVARRALLALYLAAKVLDVFVMLGTEANRCSRHQARRGMISAFMLLPG